MRQRLILSLLLPLAATRLDGQAEGHGPRLPVASCPAADSILGPARKQVLKAEIQGHLGPGRTFAVRSGPTAFRDPDPQTLDLSSTFPASGRLPGGYLTAFFPAGLHGKSRAQAVPMLLVLDDTLTLTLSTPNPPELNGFHPSTVPFSGLLRGEDLRSFLTAKKAMLTFLGEKVGLRKLTIVEAEAATRVAICYMAASTSTDSMPSN